MIKPLPLWYIMWFFSYSHHIPIIRWQHLGSVQISAEPSWRAVAHASDFGGVFLSGWPVQTCSLVWKHGGGGCNHWVCLVTAPTHTKPICPPQYLRSLNDSPPPPGKGHSLLFQGVSPMKATILEQNNGVAMETPPSLLSCVFSFLAILSQPVY